MAVAIDPDLFTLAKADQQSLRNAAEDAHGSLFWDKLRKVPSAAVTQIAVEDGERDRRKRIPA